MWTTISATSSESTCCVIPRPPSPRLSPTGDPRTEVEFLKERSPYFHVDQIKIPLLIAHGANDPRVPLAESQRIVEQLKAGGVPHRFIVFEDEGHGIDQPENLELYFAAVEEFLAEHLRGS